MPFADWSMARMPSTAKRVDSWFWELSGFNVFSPYHCSGMDVE